MEKKKNTYIFSWPGVSWKKVVNETVCSCKTTYIFIIFDSPHANRIRPILTYTNKIIC